MASKLCRKLWLGIGRCVRLGSEWGRRLGCRGLRGGDGVRTPILAAHAAHLRAAETQASAQPEDKGTGRRAGRMGPPREGEGEGWHGVSLRGAGGRPDLAWWQREGGRREGRDRPDGPEVVREKEGLEEASWEGPRGLRGGERGLARSCVTEAWRQRRKQKSWQRLAALSRRQPETTGCRGTARRARAARHTVQEAGAGKGAHRRL